MDGNRVASEAYAAFVLRHAPPIRHKRHKAFMDELDALLHRYAASRLREAAGKLRERHAPASDIDTYFADWLTERAAAEERG